jgi:serine/threonine-protein kinase
MRSTVLSKLGKGDVIGTEFEISRKLGEGGAGSVYRCRWLKRPDKEVAIKLLDDGSDMQRFVREAKVLRKTRHPNVIRLLGSGYHAERPFLILEFMDGGSLRDLLDSKGKLPAEESAWILIQTVRGLRASKAVHRDLKPENLLITKGTKGRGMTLVVGDIEKGALIKVADFGLAKQPDPIATRLTNSGQVMGTPTYMSPEQCRNTKNASFKSDIYSIGVLFYEMVFGRPPFDASNSYDIMAMHCNDEPKIPRIDQKVREIISKCLQKSPGKRYASLFALEKELSEVAGLGEPEPDSSWFRTFTITVAGLALLTTLLWIFRERVPFAEKGFEFLFEQYHKIVASQAAPQERQKK